MDNCLSFLALLWHSVLVSGWILLVAALVLAPILVPWIKRTGR